jgi:DNA mismatch repair ATPase MutL
VAWRKVIVGNKVLRGSEKFVNVGSISTGTVIGINWTKTESETNRGRKRVTARKKWKKLIWRTYRRTYEYRLARRAPYLQQSKKFISIQQKQRQQKQRQQQRQHKQQRRQQQRQQQQKQKRQQKNKNNKNDDNNNDNDNYYKNDDNNDNNYNNDNNDDNDNNNNDNNDDINPRSTVIFEKLTVAQLFTKCLTVNGIQTLTLMCLLKKSVNFIWASLIQSKNYKTHL